MASGEGTNEIILGIVLTAIGFGSILLPVPVVCCGFAIFGPILFFVGLYKLLRAPQHPVMYYPPAYPPGAYAPPQQGWVPPPPPAPTAPAPAAPLSRACASCGSENRGDAKFCTSCGAPF
jgi:hypothetical protein